MLAPVGVRDRCNGAYINHQRRQTLSLDFAGLALSWAFSSWLPFAPAA